MAQHSDGDSSVKWRERFKISSKGFFVKLFSKDIVETGYTKHQQPCLHCGISCYPCSACLNCRARCCRCDRKRELQEL